MTTSLLLQPLTRGYGLEAIDFQPPTFFRLLVSEFTKIMSAVSANNGVLTQKMLDDSNIKKLVSVNPKMYLKDLEVVDTSKEPEFSFNMACYFTDFGNGHILNRGLFEDWKLYKNELANEERFSELYQKSKGVLRGGVDLKNGCLTGDFCRIPFKVVISDDFFSSILSHTETDVAEVVTTTFLHEIGHEFDQFEYLVYAMRTNIVLHSAIAHCLSQNDKKKRFEILVDLENELQTPIGDKKALVESNDPALYYVSIKGRVDKERLSIYQSYGYDDIQNENGADIFAARYGGAKYIVKMNMLFDKQWQKLRKPYKAQRTKDNLMGMVGLWLTVGYFTTLGGVVLNAITLVTPAVIIAAIGAICWLKLSEYNDNYTAGTYDDYYGRSERMVREMVANLREANLSAEEKKILLEDIDGAKKMLETIGKQNPLIKKFVLLFNQTSRREFSIKQLQVMLESMVNNDLYVASEKFNQLQSEG